MREGPTLFFAPIQGQPSGRVYRARVLGAADVQVDAAGVIGPDVGARAHPVLLDLAVDEAVLVNAGPSLRRAPAESYDARRRNRSTRAKQAGCSGI